MRRSYCILIGVLLTAAVTAQPRMKVPEYWVGVHGGFTASSVIFQPSVSGMSPLTSALTMGGNGGIAFRFAGHKYCHFQMELNYMHRGWSVNDDAKGKTFYNLHYVEFPILMNLNFGTERCRWLFNLGPQIGYCVWDESSAITHPFNWGLAAGTGLYVRTTKAGVYELEVRFDYSFGGVYGTNVTDKYRMASPIDLSINLGYYWPIKKKFGPKKNQKIKHNEDQLPSTLRVEPDGREELRHDTIAQ